MWNGTIAEAIALEPGWALCDGRSVNGKTTPDLRDKFIVGATSGGDNVYPGVGVGQTGGSADAIVVSHTHDITDNGHTHNITLNRGNLVQSGGADSFRDGGSSASISTSTTGIIINSTGTSETNANLPPYYALAFIMRVA